MGLDNPLHIVFLVVVLLLLFGAKRIPEIGRSLGTGLREFKQSINGESPSHEHVPPPLPLPPAAPQQPVPTQASAQEAFAQRDPASTEQR